MGARKVENEGDDSNRLVRRVEIGGISLLIPHHGIYLQDYLNRVI